MERWVVFLNGGFDPQYARGRGVHMVDVWTGAELFDFSYPDGSTTVAADDPRWQLRFPVAAPVGMMRWGTAEKMPDRFDTPDNFFDTATFGDTGGQLWTLRFHVPGTPGTDGKVTNWYGGRAFQLGSTSTSCKLCGGQPFFQITANGPTPADRVFRAYLGTGDRFNLTDKHGGTCGPSNLRACALRGCTVTLSKDSNLLSAPGTGYLKAGLTQTATCGTLTLDTASSTSPITSCTVDGKVAVVISNCPSPDPNTAPTGFTRQANVTCTELTDGYRCQRTVDQPGSALTLSDSNDAPNLGNWFFSIRIFRAGEATDPLSKPVFVTPAQAKTYDSHRSWVTQAGTTRASSTGIVLIDSTAATPATLATEQSAGWGMYYAHDGEITIDQTTVDVSWMDERTASGSTLTSGLIAWNTVQPPLSTVRSATDPTAPTVAKTCEVAMCKQVDRRVNYLYGADPVTGGISPLFLNASGAATRSVASYRLVPAQALQSTVFINKKGQVQVALTGVSPEQGAINVGAGESEDPITESGVITIDEELYACRHADAPVCK
jgi:type IV pilus assembly protein PilY1